MSPFRVAYELPKIILVIITINASKNVKLFGSTKRTECLEQASVETNTSTLSSVSRLALQALSVKQEKEATTL